MSVELREHPFPDRHSPPGRLRLERSERIVLCLLETLLQAVEYQAQGHDTTAWQETSVAALRTDAAKQLAQAISATDPRWWSAFAASYRELRASAQGRTRKPGS